MQLIYRSARPEDDGDYILNAVNENGQAQTSATLTVQLATYKKFADVSVPEGGRRINAVLSGPAAWYRNSKYLNARGKLNIIADGIVHILQSLIPARSKRRASVSASLSGGLPVRDN